MGFFLVASIDANPLVATWPHSVFICKGQCYGAASNMTDSRNGVTAQMKSEENCAVLNHCYGHAQNLALSDTVKKTKICRDGIDIGYKVSKLIRFSPKRKATLE